MTNLPNRTFGIELEMILPAGMTRDGLAQALRNGGVSAYAAGYSHTVSSAWRVITDASLGSDGAEVVSPILSGESGIEEARKVADIARAAGCTVNISTGFHVHVGASDFTAKQVCTASLTFIWFESFFDQIMPVSRRADKNRFVLSNRALFGGYGTDAVNAAFAHIEGHRVEKDNYFGAFIASTNGRNSRYLKFNVAAFLPYDGRPGFKTIEFRQHSGTLDADKIENWIRLCVAFVDKAKTARPRRRTVTRDLTSAEEMHQFFAVFHLPASTRAFYQGRRKTLAKADRKEAKAAAARAA